MEKNCPLTTFDKNVDKNNASIQNDWIIKILGIEKSVPFFLR